MALGIDSIKKLIVVSCDITRVFEQIMKDKKLSLSDLKIVYDHRKQLKAVLAFVKSDDLDDIFPEVQDIDQTEIEELDAFLRAHLDLQDDTLEGRIEMGFGFLLNFLQAIMFVMKFAKKVKK